MRLPLALTIACIAWSSTAEAQLGEVRLASAGFEYQAPVTIGNVRASIDTWRFGVSAPLVLVKDKLIFAPSLNYQLITFSQVGSSPGAPYRLHLITAGTSLVHIFDKKWIGVLTTSYGIASDLGGALTADDFFVTGAVMLLHPLTKEFTVGAGVSYDRRTGTLTPIPLGIIYWEPIRNFSVRALAPASVTVSVRPLAPITFELTASLDGQRYNLHVADPQNARVSLAYSNISVGPGIRLHLGKLVHLEALGGIKLWRRYEPIANGHEVDTVTLPTGAFFGLNAWFGLSGWRDEYSGPIEPKP